jgi:hypothetical protein
MAYAESTVASAYRYGDSTTRDDAFRYMLGAFPRLVDRSSFNKHIDVETLCRLISSPAVQAQPQERLDGVLSWVASDRVCRQQFLDRLLAHIPGALIDTSTLKRLRCRSEVLESRRALNVVNDMIGSIDKPYFETRTNHALGLTSLRDQGGEKLFQFITADGKAEFEVLVEASACLTHVKFRLSCNRVAAGEGQRLPVSVSARIRVKLCCEEGRHGRMSTVRNGEICEGDIPLVSRGCTVEWRRRLHVDPCEMRQSAACGRKFALYVQVEELKVNKACFDYKDARTHHPHHHHHHHHCVWVREVAEEPRHCHKHHDHCACRKHAGEESRHCHKHSHHHCHHHKSHRPSPHHHHHHHRRWRCD